MELVPDREGAPFRLRENVFKKLIDRVRVRKRNLIVSSEDLFFLDRTEIARLAEAMHALADRITVIAYLRRQDEMALSQWAQGAKTIQSCTLFGGEASPLSTLTPDKRNYLDYAARLDDWQAEFPDAEFVTRIYDRGHFPDGNVVQDFLDILGLKVEGDKAPRDINAAFGTTKNQFLYWLRAQGLTQPEIRAVIERNVIEEKADRLLPSRAEAEAFMANFAESNARLADRLGVAQAFSSDFSTYPERAEFGPLDADYKLETLMRLTLSLREGLR